IPRVSRPISQAGMPLPRALPIQWPAMAPAAKSAEAPPRMANAAWPPVGRMFTATAAAASAEEVVESRSTFSTSQSVKPRQALFRPIECAVPPVQVRRMVFGGLANGTFGLASVVLPLGIKLLGLPDDLLESVVGLVRP